MNMVQYKCNDKQTNSDFEILDNIVSSKVIPTRQIFSALKTQQNFKNCLELIFLVFPFTILQVQFFFLLLKPQNPISIYILKAVEEGFPTNLGLVSSFSKNITMIIMALLF